MVKVFEFTILQLQGFSFAFHKFFSQCSWMHHLSNCGPRWLFGVLLENGVPWYIRDLFWWAGVICTFSADVILKCRFSSVLASLSPFEDASPQQRLYSSDWAYCTGRQERHRPQLLRSQCRPEPRLAHSPGASRSWPACPPWSGLGHRETRAVHRDGGFFFS